MFEEWSAHDERLLKTLWGKTSLARIRTRLDIIRPEDTIYQKAVSMGLPKKKQARRWSKADENILTEYWDKEPLSFIREKLSVYRSNFMISQKAYKMSLGKRSTTSEKRQKTSENIIEESITYRKQILQEIAEKKARFEHQEKCGW